MDNSEANADHSLEILNKCIHYHNKVKQETQIYIQENDEIEANQCFDYLAESFSRNLRVMKTLLLKQIKKLWIIIDRAHLEVSKRILYQLFKLLKEKSSISFSFLHAVVER
jgi:uncharacterized protein YcgL (UPF0745 family)